MTQQDFILIHNSECTWSFIQRDYSETKTMQQLRKLNPFGGSGSRPGRPPTGRRMSLGTELVMPREPLKIFTMQELHDPLFIKKTNTCRRRASCSDLPSLAALPATQPHVASAGSLIQHRPRQKRGRKSNATDKMVSIEEIEEEMIDTDTKNRSIPCTSTIEQDIDQSGDYIDDIRGHVNTAFKFDHTEGKEYFVNSFGKKGKDIGEFQDAKDIIVASNDRIIVTDLINNRVQVCNTSGRATMMHSGEELLEPWSVSVTQSGDVAVTSCRNKSVVIVNEAGDVIKQFGSDRFQRPTGIAADQAGQFIVCDSLANRVSIHGADGDFVRYVGNPGFKEQTFSKPRYVCCSATGEIIISDSGNHKIKVFDSKGDFIRSIGSFGKLGKQFKTPYGVCCNSYGDVFVADHYNNRISMFTQDGIFIRHVVGSEHGLMHPQGIALSDDLHLYVTHGHLKATEIAVFKLGCSGELGSSSEDTLSHL